MSEQTADMQPYTVSIYEPEGTGGVLVFTFVPKAAASSGPNAAPRRVPQFMVAARQEGDKITFDWGGTQDDPKSAREELEKQAEERIRARVVWIESVKLLVDQVETWASDLHWSTRRVEKKLDDAWIGKHRVPALLMQEDTCRILLEPVGRSVPGAEGVVDLYLMPAYDDIARLYYYGNRWNVHYLSPDTKAVATVREAEAMPLSKEALAKVLAELRQHAA